MFRWPVAEGMLLLAALVLVPWGWSFIAPLSGWTKKNAAHHITNVISLLAAVCLVFSFSLPHSEWAASLAVPWCLITLAFALAGAWRLAFHVRRLDQHFAQAAGMMLLSVGGVGTVIARSTWRPLGFSEDILLLTGVHFHYAGFLLPLLASRIVETFPNRWTKGMVIGIIASMPLVGLGMTFSPIVEIAGVALLVACCLGVAAGQMAVAARRRSPRDAGLLLVSSLSLASGMALAVVYASGEFLGAAWISIPAMVVSHGLLNGLGFVGCGLWAWEVARGAVSQAELGGRVYKNYNARSAATRWR
jgi:hypothetical protein